MYLGSSSSYSDGDDGGLVIVYPSSSSELLSEMSARILRSPYGIVCGLG